MWHFVVETIDGQAVRPPGTDTSDVSSPFVNNTFCHSIEIKVRHREQHSPANRCPGCLRNFSTRRPGPWFRGGALGVRLRLQLCSTSVYTDRACSERTTDVHYSLVTRVRTIFPTSFGGPHRWANTRRRRERTMITIIVFVITMYK